jgi:hypothetical protein
MCRTSTTRWPEGRARPAFTVLLVLAAMNGAGSIPHAGGPRHIDARIHGVGRIMAAPSAG